MAWSSTNHVVVTNLLELPGDGTFRTTLLFSVTDKVGILDECLSAIKKQNISLTRIESRPSKTPEWDYDFFVDFNVENATQLSNIVSALKNVTKQVKIAGAETTEATEVSTPWFPRKKSDLDTFADKVLEMGEDLDSDHPGANDPEYRARRAQITRIAKTHKSGQPIPTVEYTTREIETWGAVFQCTGFTLRPVMGLLTSRDFLNGLAFRVFHSTQYIRHHSKPFYTPEPDVCHELLGHVPLFCDPDFADFSQIYWFTVEFGLCRQEGGIRAYGAGLLSSFGELEYSLSDKPEKYSFDPYKTSTQKYIVTEYQKVYFVADSFKDAQQKVREFAKTMNRRFSVRYNPYTETIEVLDNKDKILRYAQNIKSDFVTFVDALERIGS
nr:8433_t:CDS:10 [Entrophospora candida]